MRKIKFRAFHKETKTMINIQNMLSFSNDGSIWINENKQKPINTFFGWVGKDFVLMQYTGLKDKNGVEIYESDIIKAIWSKDCDEYIANEEWIGDIFFNYGSFDINGEWCVPLNCFNGTLEVIGNIYENKELLV